MDNIKISRRIDTERLRSICIEYQLFTEGNNATYEEMFQQARQATTDEDFIAVAENIWEHSNQEKLTREDFSLVSLVWYVFNECVRTNIDR